MVAIMVFPPFPAASIQITTIPVQETTGSSVLPAGSYLNFGFGFAKAAVPSGSKVDLRSPSGVSLATQQYDGVATYGDGSLRFATFKFKTATQLSAGGTDTYQIWSVPGSAVNTTSLTTTAITAHNFTIVNRISGVTWTASLNSGLVGANVRVVSQGPVCKEWRVNQPFFNGATPHTAMWARFYVRLHEDNATIRVAAESVNSYVQNGADIAITGASWQDGATSIVSYGAFTHYRQAIQFFGSAAKDENAYWTQNQPNFAVIPNPGDLQTGNVLWKQYSSAAFTTAIGAAPTLPSYGNGGSYLSGAGAGTMFNNVIDIDMDATGNHLWLGQVMIWDGKALATQRGDWHRYAMTQNMSSFTAPAHWYESSNFNPPVLNNVTYSGLGPDEHLTSWNIGATLTVTGGAPLYEPDPSHYPAWAIYPYITTGDHWWLDELQAHAISITGQGNPGSTRYFTRNYSANGTQYYGVSYAFGSGYGSRGAAWAIRATDEAEWFTPDSDPAKQYFKDLVAISTYSSLSDTILDMYGGSSVDATVYPAAYSTLGSVDTTDVNAHSDQSPFEHDFVALVLAKAIARGRITTSHAYVANHIANWTYGRMANGCAWSAMSPYRLGLRIGTATTWSTAAAATWSQVNYDSNDTNLQFAIIPGGGCPTSGLDSVNNQTYLFAAPSYPIIAQAAGLAGQQVGITNSSFVATYAAALETAAAPTEAFWTGCPQWRIRP